MYRSQYCDELKDHCREGHSILSFICHLDEAHQVSISHKQLLQWAEDYEDFRLALEIAQAAEVYYWEAKASAAMKTSDSQTLQLCKFMLDQKYALFESIYKKTLNKNTLDQLTKGRPASTGGDPTRDVLEDM